jgi:hypothetical protein
LAATFHGADGLCLVLAEMPVLLVRRLDFRSMALGFFAIGRLG